MEVRNISNQVKKHIYFLPFVFIIGLFLAIPFFNMVRRSFLCSNGQWGIEQYREIFTKKIYVKAITNSIVIALTSTILGLVIDFLTTISLDKLLAPHKRCYLALLNLTSTYAGLPLTMSFITILGTSGVFVLISRAIHFTPLENYNLYSLSGMFIIFLYFQIPMGTLLIVPAIQKVKKEWKEAAKLMNCSSLYFWIRVGIPVMWPALMGTFSMLFTNALTAYTTPYLLTGNNIAFLPIKIADMYVGDIKQRPELGSALSMVMLFIIVMVLAITNCLKRCCSKGYES